MTAVRGPAGTLYVDDGGESRDEDPVVFVHSLAGNATQWAAQLAHLRPRRRAVALDLRGHGRSAEPADGNYAIPAIGADVAAAVDALDLERFVLVGHSAGGAVAVACAADLGDRISGLLLVDPNGDQRRLPAEMLATFFAELDSPAYGETVRAHWTRITEGGVPAVRTAVIRDLEQTPRRTFIEVFRALSAFEPIPALERYRGPKLSLITALNESPIALHRLARDLPHRLVPGTGHWIHMDKPGVFNRLLDAFLSECSRSGPARSSHPTAG
ncbi:MAG: alpha/beta hydrolase [Gemmatimonadetes bacterium]|nr:MAG: alpha/beta hydrolase [Gemmatimonadota bacterium]